jgi:hypothetical protein
MLKLRSFGWLGIPLVVSALGCGSSGDSDDGMNRPIPGTGGSGGTAGAGGTGETGGTGAMGGTGGLGGSGGVAPDGGGGTGGTETCVNGEQQSCGTDEGACVAGFTTCTNGAWGPCLNSTGPAEETCDGLDHDCDGTPNNPAGGCDCQDGDSRSCYEGPAGTEDVGSCAAGTESCIDGTWGDCQGAVEPEPGRCDALSCTGDPNPGCDCVVGESRSCFSGSPSDIDVGTCHEGVEECLAVGSSGSSWGPCTGEVLPETELCDGQDHDCNGVADDPPAGCACNPGSTQTCYTGPSSTEGVGTCAAGSQSCVLSSGVYTWGACQGDVTPVPGDCDNASCTGTNDLNPGCSCLNGASEDCYTGPSGTAGVGACSEGARTCVDGAWAACIGQVVPTNLDLCVPPTATYASYTSSDLDCNGQLDRHDPESDPTATAPTGTLVTPLPSGYVDAIQVLPLDTITLHGAGSDVDGTGPMSYRWRLLSAPAGNATGLSGAPGATPADESTQQNPTLFAQLVGDYEVGLRVLDATGCLSAEKKVLVRVKPNTALHVQLTWDESSDVDLHMVQGGTNPFGSANSCYFGDPNPDWGTVDPSLDIDDLAGCNPENIHYGEAGGAQPPVGSDYGVFVHYYCDFRGHRVTQSGDPTLICYESGSQVISPVVATVRVYVDGQLAKIDGTSQDAVFEGLLEYWDVWKPARLEYDATGVWRVHASTEPLSFVTGCSDLDATPTCVCGQDPNSSDPYCGDNGAACRQLYP